VFIVDCTTAAALPAALSSPNTPLIPSKVCKEASNLDFCTFIANASSALAASNLILDCSFSYSVLALSASVRIFSCSFLLFSFSSSSAFILSDSSLASAFFLA